MTDRVRDNRVLAALRLRQRGHTCAAIALAMGLSRQVVDARLGHLRRVELFARTKAPAWAAWGNDTERFTA